MVGSMLRAVVLITSALLIACPAHAQETSAPVPAEPDPEGEVDEDPDRAVDEEVDEEDDLDEDVDEAWVEEDGADEHLDMSASVPDPSRTELASPALTLEIATLISASEDCTTADWTSAMLYFDALALGGLAAYNAASPRFTDPAINDALVGVSIALASLSLVGATIVAAGACRANRPMSDSWSLRPRTVSEARAYREAASVVGGTFSIRELSTAPSANRDWPVFVFFLHVAATMGVFIPTLAVPDDQGWLAVVTSGVLMGAVVYGVVSLGQLLSQASNRAWVRRRIIDEAARDAEAAAPIEPRVTLVPIGSPTSAGLLAHVTY